MRAPIERRSVREIHRRIEHHARKGEYGMAAMCLELAPMEYRAVMALTAYVANCLYASQRKALIRAMVEEEDAREHVLSPYMEAL